MLHITYPILHTGFASVCLSQDDGSRIYFSRVPHTVFEARGLAHLNLHLESTNFRQPIVIFFNNRNATGNTKSHPVPHSDSNGSKPHSILRQNTKTRSDIPRPSKTMQDASQRHIWLAMASHFCGAHAPTIQHDPTNWCWGSKGFKKAEVVVAPSSSRTWVTFLGWSELKWPVCHDDSWCVMLGR